MFLQLVHRFILYRPDLKISKEAKAWDQYKYPSLSCLKKDWTESRVEYIKQKMCYYNLYINNTRNLSVSAQEKKVVIRKHEISNAISIINFVATSNSHGFPAGLTTILLYLFDII